MPRYRLLETPRICVLERLAQAEGTEPTFRRHALHAAQVAESFDAVAVGLGPAASALQQLDSERPAAPH